MANDTVTHDPTICERDAHLTFYVYKGWKSQFACPTCGRTCYQSLNFLGQRNVVCNGKKFTKEAR